MTELTICLSDVRFAPSLSTAKERDSESGNDYFGARYYASTMGRFLSPDWAPTPWAIPYAVLGNPQSLNLYAYAANNPLRYTDPSGHWHQECGQQTSSTNANGDMVVNANCHNVADFWDYPGIWARRAVHTTNQVVHQLAANPRARLAADGVKNGLIGYAKTTQAAAELLTAETGIGGVAAAYTFIGALGNDVSATTELMVSALPATDEELTSTQEAAEKMNVVTSAGGLAGLALSGGDWKAGEQGATLEAAGTLALGNGDAAVRMNVLGLVGDVLDKAETTLDTANIIDPPKQ